ncbi:MAG: hypothetical protein AAHH96_02815 [Candidatus Symbiodolus clandestinus]
MKISGGGGSGDGGRINTDPPKGILKTANNNELFFSYIKDLEDSLNNISQLRKDVSGNYEEFSRKTLSADRLEVLDITLKGVLNNLESIEDLMFVENKLEKYSENFFKTYHPGDDNNPCASLVDFFEKGLTMVKGEIALAEEKLLEKNPKLPTFEVSDYPVNQNQKKADFQLKIIVLAQGNRVLKAPIDDPSIKNTTPRAVAWFGYQNQPRKGDRYFASLLTYTPRKLSMPTSAALQKCITDKDPEKTAKRQSAGEDHASKTGSSKTQADDKIASSATDISDFLDTDNKTNLPNKNTVTAQTTEEQPGLLTKDPEKNPKSQASKEKEPVTHRDPALLSNNPNLMVLLNSQNPIQARPAVTAEKPVENSKPTSQKTPTLKEFLEELEALLNETSESAEAVAEDREKAQDSELLRKLKQLKPARFIQQQLDRKDPCNAERNIRQHLEKIEALHKNLRSTKLETRDVNEALIWLSNTIRALTQAKKDAAAKCARFRRTFSTVNS